MDRPHRFRLDSALSIAAILTAVVGCSEQPASEHAVAPTVETEALVQTALADSAVERQRTAVVALRQQAMRVTSVDDVIVSSPAQTDIDVQWNRRMKVPSHSGTVGEGTADMKAVEGLRQVLADSVRPSIRAEAAIGLGATMDVDSMPELMDAMADESLEVRRAAGDAVYRIVGLNAGFLADGPVDEREKSIGMYRNFWDENKDAAWGRIMRDRREFEVYKQKGIEDSKRRRAMREADRNGG
jgi:hypothetical protein